MVAHSGDFSSGDNVKAQVLAATDIVQLIGQTVKLTKRGKNYVGLCPFHNERSPSFNVNPAKQFFNCFGCGVGGDAFTFVMKRDRVEFSQALRTLAEAAGIEWRVTGHSKEKSNERQMMLDAHVAAVSFFQSKLRDESLGAAGREYLQKRGFTAETIERFRIGVAPDGWDNLLRSPLVRKFPPQILALGGLVKSRDGGNGFYDTFRNRLMFPIRNEQGQTIAFGGRVMPGSQDPAKYLNSPETPLFSKGRTLFGFDQAKPRIVEKGMAAIVEGYTDVMMAHQFGVTNVVAALGTGLTEEHLKRLRLVAQKVVLLFDADTAGDKAAERAVQLFLTQGIEIAVASMPQGMDPDEYLLQHGAEEFEKILSSATDVLTFQWKLFARQFMTHGNDLAGQQKAVEEYLELLAAARGIGPVDSLRWGSALTRVSRLTEIPIDVLNRRFKMVRPPSSSSNAPRASDNSQHPNINQTRVPENRRRAEGWLLGLLLSEPGRWHDVQVQIGVEDFLDVQHRQIAEVYWNYQRDEGELVFSTFLGLIEQQELKELSIELVEAIEGLKEETLSSIVGGSGPLSALSGTGDDPTKVLLDLTLADAIGFITGAKRGREQLKILAALKRGGETNESPEQENQASERQTEELKLFEALVKNNPSTNLHRLGPVKRGR